MGIDIGLGIAWLLRVAWLAGTLPIIIASLPFSRLDWLHQRVMGFASRGKTVQASTRFTVPQRLFSHFYLVAVMWTSLLLGPTWIYAHNMEPLASEPFSNSAIASHLTGGSHLFSSHIFHLPSLKHRYKVWKSVLLLLLMEVQVLRRLQESVYVFNYSPSARMHIMGYLTGIFFYTVAPLSLCCNILPEVVMYWVNLISEFMMSVKGQMPPVQFNFWEFVIPLIKLGWRQRIGSAIFIWGWIHQHQCHKILGSLRENKAQSDKYVLPYGDWFEIVSCPHYLAEIVILHLSMNKFRSLTCNRVSYDGYFPDKEGYIRGPLCCGWSVRSNCVLGACLCGADSFLEHIFLAYYDCCSCVLVTDSTGMCSVFWQVANLAFAAIETHRWYKHKFENYPWRRYAIIPFVC